MTYREILQLIAQQQQQAAGNGQPGIPGAASQQGSYPASLVPGQMAPAQQWQGLQPWTGGGPTPFAGAPGMAQGGEIPGPMPQKPMMPEVPMIPRGAASEQTFGEPAPGGSFFDRVTQRRGTKSAVGGANGYGRGFEQPNTN